jgi:hypothetical protein
VETVFHKILRVALFHFPFSSPFKLPPYFRLFLKNKGEFNGGIKGNLEISGYEFKNWVMTPKKKNKGFPIPGTL